MFVNFDIILSDCYIICIRGCSLTKTSCLVHENESSLLSTSTMTSQKYLTELITNKRVYKPSVDDLKKIQIQGIGQFIYDKLNTNKFKASKSPKELEEKIKFKINYCLEQRIPIHITVPFGGYKKWQLPTYPLPDWSEVFAISLLIDYLTPIATMYKYGVILEFFSDEIFVSRMNNYPQADLNNYNDQFSQLVEWFKKVAPSGMVLKSSKIRDQISQEEILKRFDAEIIKLKDKWNDLPEKERDYRIAKSERNYKGDLSKLNKSEKDKILLESTLVHDAFIFGDWETDVPWAFDKDMIAVGYRYTGTWGIHIRSTRSSTVQFWIGIGALIKRDEDFVPTSLTYKQYLEFKDKLTNEHVDIFPKTFTNLQKIPIV